MNLLSGTMISLGGAVLITTIPPPQYDHPYHGPLVVHEVSESEAFARCHGAPACAFPPGHGHPCVIVLPRGSPALALMRRHELGHCNGRPSYHPGAGTVRMPLK
jgi:hypothetical protein